MNDLAKPTETTHLRIRGMVCTRCVEVVRGVFERAGLTVEAVQLGQIGVRGTILPYQMNGIRSALEAQGFSLLVDPKAALLQRIKDTIEQTLNRDDLGEQKVRYSHILAQTLAIDYDTLSTLFSSLEGVTLEKYIINRRLDKTKELLVYTDLSLTEIAYRTGFSSVPHLSNQFKRLTGLSPSYFRDIRCNKQALQKQVSEIVT